MTQPGVYFTPRCPVRANNRPVQQCAGGSRRDFQPRAGPWPACAGLAARVSGRAAQDASSDEKYDGAVLLAIHHPAFVTRRQSPDSGAGGSTPQQLGDAAGDRHNLPAGRGLPARFSPAHAHNYQRYTRTVNFGSKEFDVPFIVCGDGGHHVNPAGERKRASGPTSRNMASTSIISRSRPAVNVKGIAAGEVRRPNYGYLRIHVDKEQLRHRFPPSRRPDVGAVAV